MHKTFAEQYQEIVKEEHKRLVEEDCPKGGKHEFYAEHRCIDAPGNCKKCGKHLPGWNHGKNGQMIPG